MDILEINAVSFAGRVAHVAAAELAGLLKFGEVKPLPTWFTHDELEQGIDVTPEIEDMTAYVAKRSCGGETLYLHRNVGDWNAEDPAIKMAFDLFASTAGSIVARIVEAQNSAEKALELATRPAPAAIDVEDTIYEKEESLHAQRPEAVAAQEQIASYDQAQKAERKAKREAKRLAEAAKRATRSSGSGAAKPPAKPAPMSIGEAPATPPVNRGGRGNRKR
ncbi:hypothetical protein EN817_17590 [Mesorhizobium sp. M3A.F.Ca.ET.174.01.1.1]|uniref:hypothetical protein n=1 Tax=unclassified Mesorhizobium TaxID=325217 RepID=UPI00109408AE|nr:MULTISPECIES: hypothetical protein [unclassified Mesorhizobium]TGS86715.1 hypothetical protein EN818_15445 [Mesorhizobium sp. M3A.F.Ca.ET.175.01.1.1]TGT25163.1 hypothetical protein EN817_17590 [Mesorhizobium sp. M3A.F.Ca.ET.174.01.1.1]